MQNQSSSWHVDPAESRLQSFPKLAKRTWHLPRRPVESESISISMPYHADEYQRLAIL